jgi:hypothetical protein
VISVSENSNKFQKTRFWKEKSVEDVITLEGLPFNSSMISFHFWLFKKLIHTWQNNVHLLSEVLALSSSSVFFGLFWDIKRVEINDKKKYRNLVLTPFT